ncbi:MAG: plastocyanin/azurin family copper-binding protein [Nitrosopumilus sp.]
MKILLLLIPALFVIPISTNVFAQSSYDVNIPTGAADPAAPYFWQSEKDGSTSGIVEILVGDTISWENADTAAHTVTSGTVIEGPDDIFDSGLFGPGKSFSYTFTEIGDYPYYCLVHPWMTGTVIVTAGYSILPNVGKHVGDGTIFFDVEYDFNRLLSTATINEEQKSITFEIIGDAKSDNNDLELRLPSELIDGPFVIWADGEKLSDFEYVRDDGDLNVLFIPLNQDSKILTIVGTSIVPEFGPMTMMILGASVVSMIVLSQRFKPQL